MLNRPDPDAVLAQVRAQERRAARGSLRIYFGASAGVGKTFAMLLEAGKLAARGRRVLAGVVETHGRADTAALLAGLTVLAPRRLAWRGKELPEFDLDAALAARPDLILVDELAHSNVPGSRHPKRWQDVEELLAAGIDVFTTVNVQHLESLNDVVAGITGIAVGETVPDSVFDGADEVVLVDLPADELLARLRAGKVYQGAQAERASNNFFRKGNLIALRELALRRTAERVKEEVRAWRVEQANAPVWKTDGALLACVGPDAGAEQVVRNCARLAARLDCAWHAVYVETPALQRLPAGRREAVLGVLKQARELGATTQVLPDASVAQALLAYARTHNLARIVLGRAAPGRFPRWRAGLHAHLARRAPDIDLIDVGGAAPGKRVGSAAGGTAAEVPARHRRLRYLWGGLAGLAAALAFTPLTQWLALANIAMLFLLVVLLVAVRFGRGPSVLATCVCVAAFDFFFVPPRYDFAVSDVQYLITFGVMLAVGLITGQLTAGLRFQARVARRREARAQALYEFARELSGALQNEQVLETTRATIARAFGARAVLLLPGADDKLTADADAPLDGIDSGVAQWAYDHARPAGHGTDTLPGSPLFYLPLVAPMRTRGVLAIAPEGGHWLPLPEQRRQLDTYAALAAIALERVHYIEVAQRALVSMESERLRNSLLAALSHDLRTPLTALVGLSESLLRAQPPLAARERETAQALHEESRRLGVMVTNLLDMARIESGAIRLNQQWQALEEVVGGALRPLRAVLAPRKVVTRIPSDLPLLRFDAVLLERVLANLLENAAKYTPPDSTVTIAARVRGDWVDVTVSDDGPGLPAGRGDLFEKFTRGQPESHLPGVGLGLAICRAIVEAHGGRIGADRAAEGGAAIRFSLPRGMPPAPPAPDLPELETDTESRP
jgi:two-component system sensor histidine kinase KdpD